MSDEINRIYDKLEPIAKGLVTVQINQECLSKKMDDHIKEHRETARTWQRTLIGGFVKIACTAIVGFFCFLWGTKNSL